jgi:hypothetical protein
MSKARERLLQFLRDPRVAKVLQDPRTQKLLVRALRVYARTRERIDEAVEGAAHRLNLATAKDVRELKRTIRHLEEQLRAQRTEG